MFKHLIESLNNFRLDPQRVYMVLSWCCVMHFSLTLFIISGWFILVRLTVVVILYFENQEVSQVGAGANSYGVGIIKMHIPLLHMRDCDRYERMSSERLWQDFSSLIINAGRVLRHLGKVRRRASLWLPATFQESRTGIKTDLLVDGFAADALTEHKSGLSKHDVIMMESSSKD